MGCIDVWLPELILSNLSQILDDVDQKNQPFLYSESEVDLDTTCIDTSGAEGNYDYSWMTSHCQCHL